MDFNKTPFARISISLISGIILSVFITIPQTLAFILILFFLSTLIFFHYSKVSKKYIFSFSYGASLSLLFIFIGFFLSEIREVKKINIDENKKAEYIAKIVESIEIKEKSIKTILEISKPTKDSSTINKFLVLTYLQKTEKALKLNFSDRLLLNTKISSVKNNGNPYEFNYVNYLARKGIFYQIYLKEDDFIYLEPDQSFSIYTLANNIRTYLLNIYTQNNIKGEELSVLSALTLGYKSYLEKETKVAFSESGAMHVLAVSGLHVGVILGVLTFLFKPFSGGKLFRILKLILIIFSLWSFAFISGLSPSVRRAALMFSFVAVGDFSNRSGSIYNSLWASALILLYIKPSNILDVGFQLSYSAVFAIVSMQPIIYKSIYIPTKFGKAIWNLVSVSIAAQLGTMPLGLMYFNQFPSYFILTNILVIPLAFLIIYTALVLISIPQIAFISYGIAFILNFLVKTLNYWVHLIQELPFSSIQSMELKLSEVILLYFFIAFIFIFFAFQRKLFVRLALLFLFISSSSNIYGNYKKARTNYFVVYNINKSTCFNFASTDNNVLICDSTLAQEPGPIGFAAKNFWTEINTTKPELKILGKNNTIGKAEYSFSEENIYIYKGLKIAYLDKESTSEFTFSRKLNIDFIVITQNCKMSLDEILNSFHAKKIILDSSITSWQTKKWEKEAKNLNINLHIVSKQGAFLHSFN